MRVALSGASGIGKSWAAKKLAALLSLPFVESKASLVAKEIGFDINKPFSNEEFMNYQNLVLDRHIQDVLNHPSGVFDRTALDMYAFTSLNYKMGEDSRSIDAFCDYIVRCSEAVEMFNKVFIISPDQELLKGTGEYKEGRLLADVHGDDFRIDFDYIVKNSALAFPNTVQVPGDLHYDDRVAYIHGRLI